MNFEHLRTLLAVVDEGSFEDAALELGISPSAVSQRIKALEGSIGQVVVRRTAPCTPTDTGAVLLRMARQIQALEAETREELGVGGERRTATPITINADSLATWFVPVLAAAATWEDTTIDLHVEDQDHSSDLLRRGDVLGAVTSDPVPVTGCRVEPLGAMRYVPLASAELCRRFTRGTRIDWARMPVLAFNAKDELQRRLLLRHGVDTSPPSHIVPSSEGFLASVKAGLGWAMIPQTQLGTELADGSLVLLDRRGHEDVDLHWQTWTLSSARVERLTAAVRRAAEAGLRSSRPADRPPIGSPDAHDLPHRRGQVSR